MAVTPARHDKPATALKIKKWRVVEVLRQRGEDARADWVERVLPAEVDTTANASLLATLRIDPSQFAEDQRDT
jgi:hypothetical protein